MKWNAMIAASVVALLLTTACDNNSATASGSASVGAKGVEVDVSMKERDDWVSKMKSQLNDMNAEIERLSKDGSAEAKSKLETLKDKSKNLNVEIDKAQNATSDTWDDIKAGSKKVMDDVKGGFQDAKDWTAEKLESK